MWAFWCLLCALHNLRMIALHCSKHCFFLKSITCSIGSSFEVIINFVFAVVLAEIARALGCPLVAWFHRNLVRSKQQRNAGVLYYDICSKVNIESMVDLLCEIFVALHSVVHVGSLGFQEFQWRISLLSSGKLCLYSSKGRYFVSSWIMEWRGCWSGILPFFSALLNYLVNLLSYIFFALEFFLYLVLIWRLSLFLRLLLPPITF